MTSIGNVFNSGQLLFPVCYFWGDETESTIVPRYREVPEFSELNLVLSAWIFIKSEKKFNELNEKSIRQYIGLLKNDSRKLIIDSGGFKGYSQNFDVDPLKVLDIYDKCALRKNDRVIVVDRAPLPYESPKERMEKIEETRKNYLIMKEQNDKVLNTVHGWTKKEQETSLGYCLEDNLISFPSYFTLLTNTRKDEKGKTIKIIPHETFAGHQSTVAFRERYYEGRKLTVQKLIIKRFLDFVKIYRKGNIQIPVHALGVSASLSMHVLFWTGLFQQCDSANWRVKANHYKIMFAYEDKLVAEAYIGKQKINYGSTYWKEEWDELLRRCDCVICQGRSLEERKKELSRGKSEGFYNRAIHNSHHYWLNLQIAKELNGTLKYTQWIEEKVKASSGFYKSLWRILKKKANPNSQLTLDGFIKQDESRSRKFTKLIGGLD